MPQQKKVHEQKTTDNGTRRCLLATRKEDPPSPPEGSTPTAEVLYHPIWSNFVELKIDVYTVPTKSIYVCIVDMNMIHVFFF